MKTIPNSAGKDQWRSERGMNLPKPPESTKAVAVEAEDARSGDRSGAGGGVGAGRVEGFAVQRKGVSVSDPGRCVEMIGVVEHEPCAQTPDAQPGVDVDFGRR